LSTSQLFLQDYPEGIKVADTSGWLPIHHACHCSTDTDELGELVVRLADAYPEGLQHQEEEGNSPFDFAIMEGNHATIRLLALAHPNSFGIICSADYMNELLEANGWSKRHRDVVSFFIKHCKNEWTGNIKQKLASMKDEKDLAQIALKERKKELAKEKKSVAALIKDKKKYDEERKKYQDNLEQERQRIEKSFEKEAASLKQQVDNAQKHNRLHEETRKSEAKLLSKLTNGDDWAIQDLKSILQSLNARLDAAKSQFQPGNQPSVTQMFLPYLLNEVNPSKAHLLRTIEAFNLELSEVENNLVRVSTADDASIRAATRPSDTSPENASRKRARVSISPA
jgi:hypothetical protein